MADNNNKTGVIICDLDGTLVDSRADLTTGVNLMRDHYSLPPLDIDTVTGYIGDGARKLAERALRGTDIDIDEAVALMKKYYTDHMLDATELYPGITEGLRLAKAKNYMLAVATNKPVEPCRKILEHLSAAAYFDIILGAAAGYPLKPDPGMLYIVMEKTNSLPEKSWVIGDNYTDLESGRRAGLRRCFACYGFGDRGSETADLETDSFVDFIRQLPPL
jgi:phosphoglycolate phosphatase